MTAKLQLLKHMFVVSFVKDTMFSRLMPFKDAILSNIGVRGVRVAVVNCKVLPPTQPVKWEGVSNVNNLLYEDTILTVWRAYGIGKGKTYLLSQLQGMGKFFC